jgi:putative tryptophan/tyrosine transport system substrate-binding protein
MSGSTLARDTAIRIVRASRTLTLPSAATSPYLPSVDVRRAVVVALVVGILATPLAAEAQQPPGKARVGFLSTGERLSPLAEAFKEALRERGWTEGENLVVEYRFGGEKYERLRALAAELVHLKVDVIFAANAPAAQAAKEATATIPVVFHTLNDPVRAGFVTSLARPDSNMTGNAGLGPELDRKRVEVLKEVVPSLSQATVLLNPSNPMTPARLRETEETAQTLKIKLRVVTASDANELGQTLQEIRRLRPAGLILFDDPVFFLHRQRIIDFAALQRIPAVYSQSGWAAHGGLMEYAPNQREMYRQAAGYVDRILKGAKPADLPVEQPTRFELVINSASRES